MGRFVKADTHRIMLGDSEFGAEWVEIRDELSYYETQRLAGDTLSTELMPDGSIKHTGDIGRVQASKLEAYITAWQIYDTEGQLVPLSPQTLSRLDTPTCETIIAAIALTQSKAEESKKVRSTKVAVKRS